MNGLLADVIGPWLDEQPKPRVRRVQCAAPDCRFWHEPNKHAPFCAPVCARGGREKARDAYVPKDSTLRDARKAAPSKLTDHQFRELFRRAETGEATADILRALNLPVSHSGASAILRGKSSKHTTARLGLTPIARGRR